MNELNMRLNSLSNELFAVSAGKDDKVGDISRADLIATGRACAVEYMGRNIGAMRGKEGAFKSKLSEFGGSYAALARGHAEKKLIFCAAKAYAAVGKEAPMSVEQVQNDMSLYRDPIFLRAMSSIDSEVITPLLYSTISDLAGPMINITTVPLGRTKEITILPNEAFLFEDSAWGAGHSATKNYLYSDTITLNPSPKTCGVSVKWLQLISTDEGMDAGWYYAAIIRGLWSKIMAMYTQALVSAAQDARYIPSYLRYDSYTSKNWANATVAAATANGLTRDQLMAFGAYQALQMVLPNGTASDGDLISGLGPEWFRNGFISLVGRVPLYEITQAMVPGTVNAAGTTIFPTDMIFITGRAGNGYAPIYMAMGEGGPIEVLMTPSQTADFTIDINVTASLEAKVVMASKMAVIDNVV